MSTVAKILPFGFVPPPFPRPQVELIDEDGTKVENEWHRLAMGVLIDSIRQHFHDRRDFYCGGNSFIYFSEQQARNRDFLGPDFFFVWGRPFSPPRPYWAIWDENWQFPNVIVELLSDSTRKGDLGIKKDVYQDIFKTSDYFCYDVDARELIGWTLTAGEYRDLEPNEQGRLWSEQLGLWVGPARGITDNYSGVLLRFFTREGRIVPTHAEAADANAIRAAANLDDAQAEIARLQAALEQRDQPPS